MGSADVDRYYVRLTEPEQLRKRGETARALAAALELLQLVPALIEETTRLYGGFDLSSIPTIEEGCVLAAILQSSTALDTIESIVIERPELAPWREVVAKGRQDMATVAALEQHLASEPGSVQSDLGRMLVLDGSRCRTTGFRAVSPPPWGYRSSPCPSATNFFLIAPVLLPPCHGSCSLGRFATPKRRLRTHPTENLSSP